MFTIQLGHPKINTIAVHEFDTVRDLLFKLFYSDEESFYILWNQIPIAMEYKEGLPANFDNILSMNWMIEKNEEGDTLVNLTNGYIDIELLVTWNNEKVKIDSFFKTEKKHLKKYVSILQQNNSITIAKDDFLNEWNTLLKQIITSITASKCKIADTTERRKLELLQQTENAIKSYGKLYVNTKKR